MILRRLILWASLCLLLGGLVGCAGAASYKSEMSYDTRSAGAPMEESGVESDGFFSEIAPMQDEANFDDSMSRNEPMAPPPSKAKPPSGGNDKTPGKVEVPSTRLVIYNAQLGLYVFKMEDALARAKEIGKKHQGWIQQSTSSSMTLRVPAAQFEDVMEELEKLGDIKYRNVTGTDVTEQFYDTQIRLKNAELLRTRYAELLVKARNVKDSLEIERELARVTQEIELLKGKLRFLKDQIAFSTITMTLERKTDEPVNVSRIPLPFGWMGNYNLDAALR